MQRGTHEYTLSSVILHQTSHMTSDCQRAFLTLLELQKHSEDVIE